MKKILLLLSLLFFLGACQPAFATPLAPVKAVEAADSTYKVTGFVGEPLGHGVEILSGTAWKVRDDLLVTAGHVCAPYNGIPMSFRVYNGADQSWAAEAVAIEYRASDPAIDLCLLKSIAPGKPLPLAREPAYGSAVLYVGAPKGIWGDGVRPVFQGWYSGGNVTRIHGAEGASGSALVGEQGVIGVLVKGNTDAGLVYGVPAARVRRLIEVYDASKVLGSSL